MQAPGCTYYCKRRAKVDAIKLPSSCYVDATKATSQKRVLELRLTQRGDGLDQALKTSKSAKTPDHFVFPHLAGRLSSPICVRALNSKDNMEKSYEVCFS